ncbi:Phospholipase/carboxylesterase [Coniochaeta hoffmannii]|uniref:Phospholipase/carboxylesterase n=1 Tax=Coniochaeta hoffmannii TaxID=91930 RepID=A0AA38VHB1_9PEZI|nr:Phospholipase/carboxylesterase [Coniochaeta hoffmannii]
METTGVTIDPSAPHTHTVIFLHGRGDNARNFSASLARSRDSRNRTLADAFPSFRWVFPQAPMRPVAAAQQPGASCYQWFDVWDVRDFAAREEMQAPGLRESVAAVRGIVAEEAAGLGSRWDRVVLAGISMGAATGVHTLFNLDVPEEGGGRLAAFLGFCARCPFVGRSLGEMRAVLGLDGVPGDDGVLRRTPVLLEHCIDDPLVRIENGRALRDTLRAFGASVEWREYPSGGHWFHSPGGMDHVVGFLEKHVLSESQGQGLDDMDMS